MFAPGYWGTGQRYWAARYWPPEADTGEPVRRPGGGVSDAHWREYRKGVKRVYDPSWRDLKVAAELEPIYDLLDRTEAIVETTEPKKTKKAKISTIRREAQSILRELDNPAIPEVSRVRDLAEDLVRVLRKSSIDRVLIEGLRAQAQKIERRRKNQRAIVAVLLST